MLSTTSIQETSLVSLLKYYRLHAKKSCYVFVLAYAYIFLPKLFGLVSRYLKGKYTGHDTILRILKAAKKALDPSRLPFFAVRLLGSTYLLYPVAKYLLGGASKRSKLIVHVSTFFSAFISSLIHFPSFQEKAHGIELSTVFAIRASDTLLQSIINRFATSSITAADFSGVLDVSNFSFACFIIMYNWFYFPQNLPSGYRNWITKAANMDSRILDALRLLHRKDIQYGKSGPHNGVLDDYANQCGLSREDIDFANLDRLPCRTIHYNVTENCELHAAYRFYRGMLTSIPIYLPLNLLRLRKVGLSRHSITEILKSTLRSSAFLSLFITLCWYGVCLWRSRISKIFFLHWRESDVDSHYGPALGSALCGISSLLDYPKRRTELYLFVAPKALSILLKNNMPYEKYVFAISFATIMTQFKRNRTLVRGVFQSLMSTGM